MMKWLWTKKGYLIHVAGVAIVFASPGVQALILAHPAYAGVAGAAWGFLLHWANGK